MDKAKRHNGGMEAIPGAKHGKKDHSAVAGKTDDVTDSTNERKDELHDHKGRRDTL